MSLRLSEEQFRDLQNRNARTSKPVLQNNPIYDLQKHIVDALELGVRSAPQSPLLVTLRIGLKSLQRNDGTPKPFERIEQAIALLWLECTAPDAFSVTTANPLGGYRPDGAGGQIKGEGAKLGYPDLLMDMPIQPFHGLRIEMKKFCKTAKPTDDQVDWLNKLSRQGYMSVLCRGHQAAIHVFSEYLGIKTPTTIGELPSWAISHY